MTSRNLTEVFFIMRNNAAQNRSLYDHRSSDGERLLKKSLHEAEEGLELRDEYEYGAPPIWLDKLEEAQYTMSKIKPKLDELSSLHARHLLRSTMDDSCEEEILTENLSLEISKLMSTTHRHIQYIRSSVNSGHKMEQRLTKNVITYLLLSLQELTIKFRNSQNNYLKELNSREERSKVFFEAPDFTTIDLSDNKNNRQIDEVESFDNFLQPKTVNYLEDTDEQIDQYFQQPVTSRMTQQQLLLFEEENTKMAEDREEEVTKIVKSVVDLNDIFKDLAHMVQEQGTVLDRIDYNIENTQVKVTEGFKQLQRAELYQRKNRKIACILILASVSIVMLMLLFLTKF